MCSYVYSGVLPSLDNTKCFFPLVLELVLAITVEHHHQRRIQVLGGGGGGGVAVGFWPDTKSGGGGGGGGGEYDRVSGGPGYSTVVEFIRTGINRQRNRAAIL